ncbi:MAG: quinol-cytochrome oxidoreductase complex cytochrome b subunit [Verrucomicrobiales bacterium]|jgi:quinol-cytochrome oxidoreductase complex cytochrome b subunit
MISANLDWNNTLNIVHSLAGPFVTAIAVIAASLFLRASRRPGTICLLIGCVLIFAQRLAHAIVLLPGLGYFDRAEHVHASQMIAYSNATIVLNLVAWSVFVAGLLLMAIEHLKASRTAATPAV